MQTQPSEPKYRAPMTKRLEKFLQGLDGLKVLASNNVLTEADVSYVTDFLSENTKTTNRALKTKRTKVTVGFPGAPKQSSQSAQKQSAQNDISSSKSNTDSHL